MKANRSPIGCVLVLGLLGLGSCGDAASVEPMRDLSHYRVEQVPRFPGGLPTAWGQLFDRVMATAPKMRLGDPHVKQVVRDLFTQISWIDPRSIEVEIALPTGLRVVYRPKLPRLALARGQTRVAALAEDGTLLPSGLSDAVLSSLFMVSVDAEEDLPPVGKRSRNPVVQEAFRLWVEADTIKELTELPIVAIQRRSDYPRQASGIAPAMSFVLEDGTEICWGRARDTVDPASVDSYGKKLTMERKAQRLALVLRAYPMLQGVSRVVLDDPLVKVLDAHLQALPLPEIP